MLYTGIDWSLGAYYKFGKILFENFHMVELYSDDRWSLIERRLWKRNSESIAYLVMWMWWYIEFWIVCSLYLLSKPIFRPPQSQVVLVTAEVQAVTWWFWWGDIWSAHSLETEDWGGGGTMPLSKGPGSCWGICTRHPLHHLLQSISWPMKPVLWLCTATKTA